MDFYSDKKIVCRNRDTLSTEVYPNIVSDEWSLLPKTSIEVYYVSEQKLSINTFKNLIINTNPDYIYLNSLFNPKFSIFPYLACKLARFDILRVVVNPRGEVNPGALAIKPYKKKAFISILKLLGVYKKILWNPTSVVELNELKSVFGAQLRHQIMSNVPRQPTEKWVPTESKKFNKFVFLSRIDQIKNIELFLNVLRQVEEEVIFDIYGPVSNPRYWDECKAIIDELPDNITVTYRGAVPPIEVANILMKYDYFVLPSKGENFGHAIMDALSVGLPVLLSDNTPWSEKGVAKFGYSIPVSDVNQWVAATKFLLSVGNEEYNRRSLKAYGLAIETAKDSFYTEAVSKLFPVREKSN